VNSTFFPANCCKRQPTESKQNVCASWLLYRIRIFV